MTQVSPVTSPPGARAQQSVTGAAQQAIRGARTEYTWEDGDRTLTVTLQTDLVIEERAGEALTDALATTPSGSVTRSANSRGRSTGLPVFSSPSGALMTLPGGLKPTPFKVETGVRTPLGAPMFTRAFRRPRSFGWLEWHHLGANLGPIS